jgi:hypothetical protein
MTDIEPKIKDEEYHKIPTGIFIFGIILMITGTMIGTVVSEPAGMTIIFFGLAFAGLAIAGQKFWGYT